MSRIISWMASVSVWTFSNFIPRLKHRISQKLVWTRAVTLLNNFILFVLLTNMVFWLNERDKHSLLQRALNRSQDSELFCSTVQRPNPRQEVKRSLNSQDLAFFNAASIRKSKCAAIQACATFCSHFSLKESNSSRFGTGMVSPALPVIVQRKPPRDTFPLLPLPHLVIFSGLFSIHSCSQCRNSPGHYSCL